MILVGLTGGIASGKSTVSKMLADRGAVVIDADEIARKIVEPGEEAWSKIVEHFGPGILLADRRIDRPKLASIVFSDAAKRVLLNELTHPRVMEIVAGELESLRPTDSIVVCDIPLLAEAGVGRGMFDLIVVVRAGRETQLSRLQKIRGMSKEDASARIGSQALEEERTALADLVIENDAGLPALTEQVDALWEALVRRRESATS